MKVESAICFWHCFDLGMPVKICELLILGVFWITNPEEVTARPVDNKDFIRDMK
jgi:hypothetical protein